MYVEDLQALVSEAQSGDWERIRLVALRTASETGEIPEATVTLSVEDEEHTLTRPGSGQVDAVFKAIEGIINSGSKLLLFSVNNITDGSDSQGEVSVRLENDGRIVTGLGADTDIITASGKAYVNALNRLSAGQQRVHPQAAQAGV